MAASPSSTTLRLSRQLRDEIAELANARNMTMVEVVETAIDHLKTQQWWGEVRGALAVLDESYGETASALSGAVEDGLGD